MSRVSPGIIETKRPRHFKRHQRAVKTKDTLTCLPTKLRPFRFVRVEFGWCRYKAVAMCHQQHPREANFKLQPFGGRFKSQPCRRGDFSIAPPTQCHLQTWARTRTLAAVSRACLHCHFHTLISGRPHSRDLAHASGVRGEARCVEHHALDLFHHNCRRGPLGNQVSSCTASPALWVWRPCRLTRSTPDSGTTPCSGTPGSALHRPWLRLSSAVYKA